MAKFSLKFDTPSMRRVCEIWNASENGSTAAHNFGYFTVVQYLHGTVMQVFVFLRTVIELRDPTHVSEFILQLRTNVCILHIKIK